jgi:hypothetical protein
MFDPPQGLTDVWLTGRISSAEMWRRYPQLSYFSRMGRERVAELTTGGRYYTWTLTAEAWCRLALTDRQQ